jgi:hypothetical protein
MLPSWLKFDPIYNRITGTPNTISEIKVHSFSIFAKDSFNKIEIEN